MELQNTTLDDIASVVGFTNTMRLVAWFGEGTMFVPLKVEDGQLLVLLIGKVAAQRLSEAWPGELLAVPGLHQYEVDRRRRQTAMLLESGFTPRQVSHWMRCSERRVQQVRGELERAGLLATSSGKKGQKKRVQNTALEDAWQKPARKTASEKRG